MKWGINGIGLTIAGSAFSIFCFSVYVGVIHEDQILPSSAMLLTELLAGAAITLTIIKQVIRKDREQQWADVKEITYSSILSDLRQISAIMAITIQNCGPDNISIPSKIIDILLHPSPEKEKQVSSAIVELAELLKKCDYNSRYGRKETWFDDEKRRRACLLFCYSIISKMLDDIRFEYVPRALKLSSDQQIKLALMELDIACCRLQSASILPQQEEKINAMGAATCGTI